MLYLPGLIWLNLSILEGHLRTLKPVQQCVLAIIVFTLNARCYCFNTVVVWPDWIIFLPFDIAYPLSFLREINAGSSLNFKKFCFHYRTFLSKQT